MDPVEKKDIVIQDVCDFPQGHCFGSDGGTGIKEADKVEKGRGGEVEVHTKDAVTKKVVKRERYIRCQYCLKYVYGGDLDEEAKQEKS